MPTLSASQIAGLAQGANFTGDSLITATAVALAESSGRTDVVNSIGATGLWQILQPVHVKANPTWSKEWLKNPQNNARAAYKISSSGTNWKPWEAYTNGAYRLFLDEVRKAVKGGVVSEADPGRDPNDPININEETHGQEGNNVLEEITKFGTLLADPNTYFRLLLIVAGSLLVGFALLTLTKADNKIAKFAVKAAVTRKIK